MIDDLLRLLLADVIAGRQLGGGKPHAALFKTEQESDLALGQKAVQDPEIHMVLMHPAGKFSGDVVRDHAGQLHHHLLLDGIITVVVLYGIVLFIDMNSRVYFFGHCGHSSFLCKMYHTLFYHSCSAGGET